MLAPSTTLIIPVESQVRELDAKLLLACVAAEAGFRGVVGSRALLHYRVASLPRGIYLAKSMRSLSLTMFRLLRQLGHQIVAWDEEALVRLPSEHYYRRRLSPETLALTSHLLAWGEDDAEVFRRYPGRSDAAVHVTGNPRIDMLRPELRDYFREDVSAVRERMGRFILVNTNFGYVNAFVPRLNLLRETSTGETRLGENTLGMTETTARGIAAHKGALFHSFRAMIPRLAEAFPSHRIAVRPHPSESHEPWLAAARHHDNVVVANEGNVVPWLMAGDALVHNGCTTGVEAAVLGTPAVAYRPAVDKSFDLDLPNALSEAAFDGDELIGVIERALTQRPPTKDPDDWRALLEHHLAALEGPLAAERMVAILREASTSPPTPASPPIRWMAGAKTHGRALLKRTLSLRGQHRNSRAFHDHRFPGTSAEDLRERIERLSKQLDRFGDIRVRPLWDQIYSIERARP